MKAAIVHEWLSTYAGSERVLVQIIACFPEADVFAVVNLPDTERLLLQGKFQRFYPESASDKQVFPVLPAVDAAGCGAI